MTYLSEAPNRPAGYRQFFLEYRQPVDHRHPGRGTADEAGATFTEGVGSLDKAFEFDVVDTPFLFWQYYDNEPGIGCDTIPPPGALVADLYA